MESILEYCQRHSGVLCYGAGNYGRMLHAFLLEHGIRMNGFLITRKDHCDFLQGIPVYEAGEILPCGDDVGVIIGAGSPYAEEMEDTLRKYGRRDYFCLSEDDFMRIDEATSYQTPFPVSSKICVLCYHRVCHLPLDTWRLAVPPDMFEQHIEFLQQNYHILRFEDDWSAVKTPSVVITMDDGYFDAFRYALPILEKHHVPATVFVTTGNLDMDEEFWWDKLEQIFFCNDNLPERFIWETQEFSLVTMEDKKRSCYAMHGYLKSMERKNREQCLTELAEMLHAEIAPRAMYRSLTSEELRYLADSPYMTIGGHTVTHPALAMESLQVQEREIFSSKSVIERIIGKSIDVFAYPFGGRSDFTSHTRALVKKAGYRKIATAYGGLTDGTSPLEYVPRNGIPGDCTVEQLAKRLRKIWCVYGE